MPWRAATLRAVSGFREAMATGLNPAFRYATKWQSAMMNPAPMQPMRQSLRRGSLGRMFRARSGENGCDITLSLSGVNEEREAGEQFRGECRAELKGANHPPLAVAPMLDQRRFGGILAAIENP